MKVKEITDLLEATGFENEVGAASLTYSLSCILNLPGEQRLDIIGQGRGFLISDGATKCTSSPDYQVWLRKLPFTSEEVVSYLAKGIAVPNELLERPRLPLLPKESIDGAVSTYQSEGRGALIIPQFHHEGGGRIVYAVYPLGR